MSTVSRGRSTTLRCRCGEIIYDVEMGLRTCGHPDDADVLCPRCDGAGETAAWDRCPLCYGTGECARVEADDASL